MGDGKESGLKESDAGQSNDRERRVLGIDAQVMSTFYPRRSANRPSRFTYFGKADGEGRDLSSASTPFSPADLLASRLALFRSFLACLSSGVSSFRLLFVFVFFPFFLPRSSRHFSSK